MLINAKIFSLIILFTVSTFSQTDWVKWEKADFRYEKPGGTRHRDYTFNTESVSAFAIKSLANVYWFFISDLDGDNCPFRPSCSTFYVESVKETNFIKGTLMFFDRFTRDFNIYKRYEHYPRVKDGHYYDPVTLYTLDKGKIKYIPPSATVNW